MSFRYLTKRDKFMWRWTADQQYSASSTYKAFFQGQRAAILGAKELSKARAPPSCKFFFWLALLSRKRMTKDKPSGLGGFLWRKRNDRVFHNAVKQAAQLSAWIMEEGLRWVAAGLAEFIQ
jgi:hypothetical protein